MKAGFFEAIEIMNLKPKILIVDDHQILIDGIKGLIPCNEFEIAGEASCYNTAVEMLKGKDIDIIISDIQLPGKTGIELIKEVKQQYPDIKIIVLSMHNEKSIVLKAVKLGINAYLLKNISQEQLLKALYSVLENKFYISEEIAGILVEQAQDNSPRKLLTKRELEILKLIADEKSNRQIADTLFISERTVESHRKNIFRKTNTKTVVGLIKYAVDNLLI
ncbi:MAG: response regulator transcription factor [Bacteroidales bacterium]|nr:response regulator transcription factor [Bacteroidales bacterium]